MHEKVKGSSSISILQFSSVNFLIEQFGIFQKLLWNSVQSIWGVITNLIEITGTKLSALYEDFREKGDSFLIGESKTKSLTQKQGKIHAK